MDLSIVTTMYQSAPYLEEFYRRISASAQGCAAEYEIIFVNDGSPDNSMEVALALYERDKGVRVIELSRNFGHHKAMMTGLSHARGRLVFLIDSDLEEEPELLQRFQAEMQATSADVVYGVQRKRKGGPFERVSGYVFYKLFNFLSNCEVPQNVVTARLMTQNYVANLVKHRDREVFLLGLWMITGFRQIPVVVQKGSKKGSTYNLGRKLSVFVNSITSFSNRPLVLIFYIGCIMSLVSGATALYLVANWLFFGGFLAGWSSLMLSLWFLGGLTILSIGIVGIYLAKVFTEVKDRPYTVIRKIYDHGEKERDGV